MGILLPRMPLLVFCYYSLFDIVVHNFAKDTCYTHSLTEIVDNDAVNNMLSSFVSVIVHNATNNISITNH